jgi:hypothetical protein
LRRRKGHGDGDGRLADGCGHVRRENSADVSLDAWRRMGF